MQAEKYLINIVHGYRYTKALYVATKLGLFELIDKNVTDYIKIASILKVDRKSLLRLIQVLDNLNILKIRNNEISLTKYSKLLTTNSKKSIRNKVLRNGSELYSTWEELEYSIKTGKSAFEKLHKQNIFSYYRTNKEALKDFNQGLIDGANKRGKLLSKYYDFSECRNILDIGGGNGSHVAPIFFKYKHLVGDIFELPSSINDAKDFIKNKGLTDRVKVISGDFFKKIPLGYDLYLLGEIIHDWDDLSVIKIYKAVKRALKVNSRVVISEKVMKNNETLFETITNLHMLTVYGGENRTLAAHIQLLNKAGLQFNRITETDGTISIIEASLSK